jgi:hypothetical protein
MITQPTIETKLADWTTAFFSISNKQSEQAQILRGLIDGLSDEMLRKGMVVIPGAV